MKGALLNVHVPNTNAQFLLYVLLVKAGRCLNVMMKTHKVTFT